MSPNSSESFAELQEVVRALLRYPPARVLAQARRAARLDLPLLLSALERGGKRE